MEYYFPENPGQSHLLEERMIEGREDHVSVVMADGRVLTAGGRDNRHRYFSSTELFDPESGRVTVGPKMNTDRENAAAALIGQDVYVAGGCNSGYWELSSCERLRSGKWTPIASMNEKRSGLAMVAVDGKLFVFGGSNGYKCLSSVECYYPERDRWTKIVMQMPTARRDLAAAELNGLIYICGRAYHGGRLSVCERYDHRENRWETVASMNMKRDGFALVAANGCLYAVGGMHSEKSVEMYDPDRNEWTLLPNELIEERWMCSAVAF